MAFTLNSNVFIGTLSNMIAYSQILDTYKPGDALTKLIETFRDADISYGDTKRIISADLPTVYDTDFTTSNILSQEPNTVSEQFISVGSYKYIKLSINRYLLKGAFNSEEAMANLIAYLMKIMEVAKTLYIYGVVEGLVQTRMADEIDDGTSGHIVTLTGNATDPSDDAQTRLAIHTRNASLLFKGLKRELQLYVLGKKKSFQDSADSTGRVCLPNKDEMVCIIHPDLLASLDVDALAVLLNKDELTKGIDIKFIPMITVDNGSLEDDSYLVLCSKDAFTWGYFYQVATTFFDASTLNTNNWLHFSYYAGDVEYAPLEIIHLDNFSFE